MSKKGKKPRYRKNVSVGSKKSSPVPWGNTAYHGQARFCEIGWNNAPDRQLLNIDKITNVRLETYEEGRDIESYAAVVIQYGEVSNTMRFHTVQEAQATYGMIVEQIQETGIPVVVDFPATVDVIEELPELTPEELDQLENPTFGAFREEATDENAS
jgi:hypothetical protein